MNSIRDHRRDLFDVAEIEIFNDDSIKKETPLMSPRIETELNSLRK